jgi:hypothetical protein
MPYTVFTTLKEPHDLLLRLILFLQETLTQNNSNPNSYFYFEDLLQHEVSLHKKVN